MLEVEEGTGLLAFAENDGRIASEKTTSRYLSAATLFRMMNEQEKFEVSYAFRLLTMARQTMPARHGAIEGRDAVSMWIRRWVPKLLSKSLFKGFRDEVLKTLRFIVEFFNGIAKLLKQERFNQPVMPDDFQCPLATVVGQASSTVTLIAHQRRVSQCQLLDHVRYRRVGNSKPFGDCTAAHLLRAIPSKVEDYLQVVVDRFRVRFVLAMASHQ
jgi:hypothetical protein